MKKYANSIVAKALLILIAISFVVVGGISGGISSGSYVATVKGEKISFADFYRSYVYQAQQMGVDPALLRQTGYANIVLDGMIRDTTAFVKAKSVGVVATDVSLAQQIRENPTFQLGGVFDEQQYTAVLQSNGLDSDSYLNSLKQSTTTSKYLDTFKVFALSIPTSIDILYKHSEQSRTLITAQKSFADMAEPAITDTDVNSYYSDNQADFEVPETRSVTAIYLDNTSVATSISDVDAIQYFDNNPGVFNTPETRSYYTISSSRQNLTALIESLKSGTDVQTAVQDILNQDLDTLLTENAEKQTIDSTIQDAVFTTDAGAYSDIIEGPFSNLLVYVDSVNKATVASFDDVSYEVKKTIAYDRIFDVTVDIEDNLNNDKSLEDIAQLIGIPVTTVDITEAGLSTYLFTAHRTFIGTVFDMAEGDVSDIQQLDDETFFIVRLNTVTPAHVPPLADIKDEVTEKFVAQSKSDTLNADLQKLATLTDKQAFITRAENLNFAVETLANQQATELTDATVADAFNIKVGTAITAIDNDIGTAVFAVSRTLPDAVPQEQQQEFDNVVKTSTNPSVIYAIQSDLLAQMPAKIDQQMVDSIYGVGGVGQ